MDGGVDDALHGTDSNGNLNVFNVKRNEDGLWLNGNNGHADNFWNGDNQWLFVRPRYSLHFSLGFTSGEFCFMSCPFQPPNIFPISSIFMERAIYFLLSRDFVSQSTIRSTFNVSNFLIATRT